MSTTKEPVKAITKEAFLGSLNFVESTLVSEITDRALKIRELERSLLRERQKNASAMSRFSEVKPRWRLREKLIDGGYGVEVDDSFGIPLRLV